MIFPRLSRWQAGAIAIAATAVLLVLEIVDEREVSFLDLGLELVEILMIVATSVTVAVLVTRVEDQGEAQRQMIRELELARREGTEWRARVQDMMRGLGVAIDEQFDSWRLTPAEKDVALLLLKGLTHKEVAGLRGRAERTVRQQALAVYRKSKLSGRASLAAYFLEDLLLPSLGSTPNQTDELP